jgi:hypothetical protein
MQPTRRAHPARRARQFWAFLTLAASPLLAQGRIVDEGTLLITRTGAPAQTESFRIRVDNGLFYATGQLNAGPRRVNSALTTDSLGTPVEYKLDVRVNGTSTMNVAAIARAGRLSSRSQLPNGDESTREYSVATGASLILDDELLHQTYFLALHKHAGSIPVIMPQTSRGGSITLNGLGLEPITIAGKQVTATHYAISGGTARREFWVDERGRLLQVEIPSIGLRAVREELPR